MNIICVQYVGFCHSVARSPPGSHPVQSCEARVTRKEWNIGPWQGVVVRIRGEGARRRRSRHWGWCSSSERSIIRPVGLELVGSSRVNAELACGANDVKADADSLLALLAQQGHLRGVEASKAKLAGALLCDVDLTQARLSGCDLTGADLSRANLQGADLSGATLTGAKLIDTDLTGATLSRARMRDAILTRTQLTEAKAMRVSLSGSSLEGVLAGGADFTDAELARCKLSDGTLAGAVLLRASFSHATLSRTDLTKAELSEAIFEQATLEEVVLTGAVLRRARLLGATLKGPLAVVGADFREADLAEARLVGVDFRDADLSEALMDQVSLQDVSFSGAVVQGADFQGVEGLSEAQIAELREAGAQVGSILFGKIIAWIRASRLAQAALVLLLLGGAGGFYLIQSDPSFKSVEALLIDAKTLRDEGKNEEALALYDGLLLRAKDRLDLELALLYGKAEVLLALKRGEEAAKVFEQIAERTGNDPDEAANAQMRQANALIEAGAYEQAILLLQKLVADPNQSPKDVAKALETLARTWLKMGMQEKAISLFQETLQRFPNDPEVALQVNLELAGLLIGKRLFSDAEAMLGKLDPLARDDTQKLSLMLTRARLFDEQGSREKAMQTLDTLIKTYPENPSVSPEVKLDLAQFLTQKGEYEQASRIYKDILARTQDTLLRSQTQLAYGALLRQQGQAEQALELFRTVRKEAQNNAELQGTSLLEEAETLLALRQFDSALALLEGAIQLSDPGMAGTALLKRAQILQEVGRLDEAAALLRQVAGKFADTGELSVLARMSLAQLEASRGKLPEAIALFDDLLKDPNAAGLKPHLLQAKGQAELEGKKFDEAKATFEQLAKLSEDPEASANARFGLAQLLVAQGDRTAAVTLLKDAAANAEDLSLKSTAMDMLARLYLESGDSASALATFQAEIASLPPRHEAVFTALQAMAEIYEGRRDVDQARATYERILAEAERAEVRAGAMLAIGRLYLDAGDTTRASERFAGVIQQYPGETAAVFQAKLGTAQLLQSKGELEKATVAYQALADAAPDRVLRGQALEALSGLYAQQGKSELALKVSQQLLDQASASEDAEAKFNASLGVANAMREKGDLKGALERFLTLKDVSDRVLKMNALDGMARTYSALEEHQKALEVWTELTALAKDNADLVQNATMGLASELRLVGRGKEAVPLYEGVIKETADAGLKGWAQDELTRTYAELGQGDKAKAVQASRPAIEADALGKAGALELAGDVTGAIKAYEEVASTGKDKGERAWALVHAGRLHAQQGRADKGLELYLQVISGYAGEAEPLLNARLGIAEIYRGKGLLKEAQARYEELGKGEGYPDYRAGALLSAAEVWLELETPDKAKGLFEEVLKRFGEKPDEVLQAKLGLAGVLRAQGKYREAAVEFETLEGKLGDPALKASALLGCAKSLQEAGQKDAAKGKYALVKTRYPTQTDAVTEAEAALKQL